MARPAAAPAVAFRSRIPVTVRATLTAVVCVFALAWAPAALARPSLAAYRGTGAWVDLYDPGVRADPAGAVEQMAAQGVNTLYLETGNHRLPRRTLVGYPEQVSELIDAAHSLQMRVVAWYLPGLKDLRLDRARSLAAIRYSTLAGGHFDSFALDIESTKLPSIWRRNVALLWLSRSLRRAVGRKYALGAIVPDQRSTTLSPGLWPGFPYPQVARLYDVFLPMSYSTHRARGPAAVYRYTYANVAAIRTLSWPVRRPVHVIAGLADRLRRGEPRAAARAARDAGAIGMSFYKFTWSGLDEWRALTLFRLRATSP
jgi:hypothetical protein